MIQLEGVDRVHTRRKLISVEREMARMQSRERQIAWALCAKLHMLRSVFLALL